MSFVYAEKMGNAFDIHCDTQIGLDDCARASFSAEQIEMIRKYGIVKMSIICSEICVAFAGNRIYLASDLFRYLHKKKHFTTREVVDVAYDIHKSNDIDDIEFIVASCEGNTRSLHCIKEYQKYVDCQFAWIGSAVAHREFQGYRLENNNGKASERTTSAFLKTVQESTDNSVGGFHIIAGYNPTVKSIVFRECATFQSSKQIMVKVGEIVPFLLDAEDGGFSFEQIPVSEEDLILRIDQMKPAILYSRRFRMNERDVNNPQLFSLMLPMLVFNDDKGGWVRSSDVCNN